MLGRHGSTRPGLSSGQRVESDRFIIFSLFAFAFQMLNKVSGLVRSLCPSPSGASSETPSRPRPAQWRWPGWGALLDVFFCPELFRDWGDDREIDQREVVEDAPGPEQARGAALEGVATA